MNQKMAKILVILIQVGLLFTVFPILTLCNTANTQENSWIVKSSAIARRDLMVTAVNGKIYAIGGMNYVSCLNYNQEYDPVADKWTLKEPMPTARADSAIVTCDNKIYVLGGTTGAGTQVRYGGGDFSLVGYTNVNEVYDPATETWESKSSMPFSASGIRANVVNGKIYVMGGDFNILYDPSSDSWDSKTPSPIAVWKYASAVVNNSVYLFGGKSGQTQIQVYDAQSDNWSYAQHSPCEFVNPVADQTTGGVAPRRIYVISWSNRTHVYDPETDSWSEGAQMSIQRSAFGVAVVNDLLYVIGGGSGTFPILYPAYGGNEQYTPFGYGTIEQIHKTPTSELPPTPTLSPTIELTSPTPTETPVPSDSPTEQPTVSPSPTVYKTQTEDVTPSIIIYSLTALIAALAIIYFKKYKRKK